MALTISGDSPNIASATITTLTSTTVTATTLSDGTNSTSATNCISGSAKAWVSWNGTSGSIFASYNVSSVTRTGTGTYSINFTSAFADTSYCAVMGGNMRNSGGENIVNQDFNSTKTTSLLPIRTMLSGGSVADASPIYVACYR